MEAIAVVLAVIVLLFLFVGPLVAVVVALRANKRAEVSESRMLDLEWQIAELRRDFRLAQFPENEERADEEIGSEDLAGDGLAPREPLAGEPIPREPTPSDSASSEPTSSDQISAGPVPDRLPPGDPRLDPSKQEPAVPAVASPTVDEIVVQSAPPRLPRPEPPSVETPQAEQPWADDRPGGTTPADQAAAADIEPETTRIEWERWVGVRGAAVLGGVVLALAGVLLLKYSIENQLIPPIVRVALGFATGLAALVGSEVLRKRRYLMASNSLAGASVVLFYASSWSARVLYELIPAVVSWGLMVLVTVICGLLSWRRNSLLVASLGLIGGFATPLLLSTGGGNVIGLFSYILLLDVGLIWLARGKGWPLLGVMSLVGTVLYQLLWVGLRMGAEDLFLALAVLAVFAVLFAFARRPDPTSGADGAWNFTQSVGVLLPFLFAVYLASRSDLGVHLLPVAALALILSVLALWLSRVFVLPLLARAAAAADVAVLAVWCARADFDVALAWEATAIAAAIGLTFQLGPFLIDRFFTPKSDFWPLTLAAGGSLWVLVVAQLDAYTSLWPWLAGWLVLAGLLAWRGGASDCGWLQVVGAVGLSFGLVGYLGAHRSEVDFPIVGRFFAVLFAVAVAYQGIALVRWRRSGRRWAEIAAATAALILLGGVVSAVQIVWSERLYFALTLGLGVLLALSAARLPSGRLLLGAMLAVAMSHIVWLDRLSDGNALFGLFGGVAGVLLFTAWPFVAQRLAPSSALAADDPAHGLPGGPMGGDRWTLYAAALAAPVWFLFLRTVWTERFGTAAIGALPVLLGCISLAAAAVARRRWPVDTAQRKRSLVWFLAVALGFISVAIPLQLDKQWITIGWALEGFAVIVLWRRLDHDGLKYFGLALLAAVSVRLVANPEVLGYYPSSRLPVVNWLMYTYLVPVAALLGSARMLEYPLEQRSHDSEQRLPRAWSAAACGFAAILVTFVWINLTIFDMFSSGPRLELSLGRHMARDLTLSMAWAMFAVGLLAIGMVRKSSVLRWVSLAFLLLTIAKVFLYDLGELEDLYRVASLVGLAISLLGVSLAYQRFVFGRDQEGGT